MKSIYGIILFCVISVSCFPQGRVVKSLSYPEGLTSYNIRKVVQDSLGYIWVATQNGLYRYDGVRFKHFHTNSETLKLSGNFICDFIIKNRFLIISVYNSGLEIIDTKEMKLISLSDDGPFRGFGEKIFSLALGDELLAGGEKGIGRIKFHRGVFKYSLDKQNELITLNDQLVCMDSMVWLFRKPDCIYLLKKQGERGFKTTDSRKFSFEIHRVSAKNNELYILKSGEILTVHDSCNLISKPSQVKYPKGLNSNDFVMSEKNGDYFLSNSSVYFCSLHSAIRDSQIYNKPQGIVQYAIKDKAGNLWVATSKNLEFISFERYNFKTYTEDVTSKYRMDHVYSLIPYDSITMLACGKNGLFQVNLNTGGINRIRNSETAGVCHDVIKIEEGEFIVSTDAGLFLWQPEKMNSLEPSVSIRFPELVTAKDVVVNANLSIGDSLILLGTENEKGLIYWNRKRREVLKFKKTENGVYGIPENHIHNIRRDRQGKIWLLMDNYISNFDLTTKKFESLEGESFRNGIYFDLYDDGINFWIASFHKGLIKYSKKDRTIRRYTENDGLSNSVCYHIVPENDSVIWISTNNGLNRFQLSNGQIEKYYFQDGLQDNAFDEKSVATDGNAMYFGGVNGFTQIKKGNFLYQNKQPSLYLNEIEIIDDKQVRTVYYNPNKIQRIQSNVVQIRIICGVLDYTNAHKLKTEYKINNSTWLETEKGHTIVINNPSYGPLALEIRLKDCLYNRTSQILHYTTYIQPKWYQRTWFRLLLILLAAANAMWITRLYFKRQLIAKQKELEKQQALQTQRDRISMDMHDDLGSGLSSIKMISEMLKRKHADTSTREELDQIVQESTELTATMRDLVWSLNPRNDTLGGFIDHSRRFVKQYFEQAGIEVNLLVSCEEQHTAMNGLARRNLLLVLKETCTNIYKHADTKKVDIEIGCTAGELYLLMTDHGRGLPQPHRENNGFYSMRKRMQEIGGTIEWHSDSGGVHTEICWPFATL